MELLEELQDIPGAFKKKSSPKKHKKHSSPSKKHRKRSSSPSKKHRKRSSSPSKKHKKKSSSPKKHRKHSSPSKKHKKVFQDILGLMEKSPSPKKHKKKSSSPKKHKKRSPSPKKEKTLKELREECKEAKLSGCYVNKTELETLLERYKRGSPTLKKAVARKTHVGEKKKHDFSKEVCQRAVPSCIEDGYFSTSKLKDLIKGDERKMKKIAKKSGSASPRKLSGYNIYIREALMGASNKKEAMSKAAASWSKLSDSQKEVYNKKAKTSSPKGKKEKYEHSMRLPRSSNSSRSSSVESSIDLDD